jgi:xanthine dehydrogenase FAD-binding subunit
MFDIQNYVKANSVQDAVRLLSENPGAKLIAGGTDVLIRLREGHEPFSSLVDIHDLKELKQVQKQENGDIRIGSGCTFTELIENDIIAEILPVVAFAAGTIGGPQVRNVATIGGNLCNGAVSADSLASLCVLDAILEVEGADGFREIPIMEFYLGPGKVVLGPTEILKSILIKKENYENYGNHYYKYAMRNAMDIATIGCAASCKIENGKFDSLKVAFTVAAPKPARATAAESFAIGKNADEAVIKEIAGMVLQDLNPRDSWRASKEFREHIIKTLAERVIREAVKEAGGQL